ncbi:hypothetical protein QJQ45_025234 [Haematococcus lacustris]|nr:hypothetical protein QJQ45_025234 [Haematococcus lacustris]
MEPSGSGLSGSGAAQGHDVDEFLDAAELFEELGFAEGVAELELGFELGGESVAQLSELKFDHDQYDQPTRKKQEHYLAAAVEPTAAAAVVAATAAVAGAAGAAAVAVAAATAAVVVSLEVGPVDLRLFRALTALGSQRMQLSDKLAFLLGSSCLWVCAFWLGHSPGSFYKLYTGLGLLFFTARYATYRARKCRHYYLLDLCYCCNALLLTHLWAAPRSQLLAHTTFAFNTGPLAFSILAFRNSLVYHDMDKVTSLYLHLVPACVSWAQRWHLDTSRFTPLDNTGTRVGLKQLVLIPLAFYSVWAVSYFLTIFVFAAGRIKRRGYATLFNYVTTQKRGTFAAIARRVPRPLQPVTYLVLHCCFCAVTMLVGTCAWSSFLAHTAILVIMASLSIYHGGQYYFDYLLASRRHTVTVSASASASQAATPSKRTADAVPATPEGPHIAAALNNIKRKAL